MFSIEPALKLIEPQMVYIVLYTYTPLLFGLHFIIMSTPFRVLWPISPNSMLPVLLIVEFALHILPSRY